MGEICRHECGPDAKVTYEDPGAGEGLGGWRCAGASRPIRERGDTGTAATPIAAHGLLAYWTKGQQWRC
jgi:hypothetical protein